jgi:hypothetical protein
LQFSHRPVIVLAAVVEVNARCANLLDQYSRIPSFHGQAPFYFGAAREHGSGAVFSVLQYISEILVNSMPKLYG